MRNVQTMGGAASGKCVDYARCHQSKMYGLCALLAGELSVGFLDVRSNSEVIVNAATV